MKLKRMMSGLLSLVLAAGMIPGTIAFAADGEFTNAWGDVIRKDACLYYEDFENYTGTDFDISSDITDKGYWHNKIVSDSRGGSAMRYYATPKAAEFNANDGKSLLDKEILPETAEINKEGWYEIGFSFYPDDMAGYYRPSVFNVKLAGITSAQINSHGAAQPDWLSMGSDIFGTAYERDDCKIEIRAIVNASENNVKVYAKKETKDGKSTVFGWNNREFISKNISYKNVTSGNIKIAISCANAPSSPSVEEPSYRIDNVYVKKLPAYNLSFDKNDGTGIIKKQIISPVQPPEFPTPERDGYQFDGWYFDKEGTKEFNSDEVSGEEVTIYAKWLKIHTITFETDGGTKIEPIQTVSDTIEMPKDPIKFRHEFGGWFSDEDCSIPFDGTGITGDMTVYAKWTYAHEISFETNGGEAIDPIYTVNGVESVPDAVRVGYRFDGWFTDEKLTNKFDCTNVTEDIKVYAAWTRKHVVSFETFGGEPIDVVYTLEDLDVDKLPKAVKPGFGFEGWFTDKDLTVEFDGKNITEDIILYAKYSNVLFHEDFENGYDNDMLKQLAPDKWEQWAADGYGVVEDKKGNHEFRMAAQPGKLAHLQFTNGGPGLYEVQFKIRSETSGGFLMQPLFSLSLDGQVFALAAKNGNWTTLNGEYMNLSLLQDGADLQGYITYTWRIDTVNKTTQANNEYTNLVNRVIKSVGQRRPLESIKNEANGVKVGIGVNTDARLSVYVDDIWVRKIEQPKMVSSTPSIGAIDTELRPEIKLLFDRKLDSTTVITKNITITDEKGNELSADDYTMAENLVDGNTEIKINLKKDLEYATTYTVNVASDLKDTDGYFLANSYKVEFTTKPIRYEVTPTLVDRNGDEVKDITIFKGKPVTAKLYVRNFAGGENDNLFVSAALVDEATGRQLAYSFEEVTLAKGEGKEVLSAEFQIPESVTENYKVHYYVWNSRGERKAMTDSCVLPQ